MSEKSSPTHDVFLSFSSHDKAWADAACAVLERQWIRCWIAPRDITLGDEWGAGIIKGINGSRMMVLIFSGHANASSQVRREVERAISHGMAVLPIRIEDVHPEGAMELALGNRHWLDAFTPPFERHLELVARSVKTLLSNDVDAARAAKRTETPETPPIAATRIGEGGLSTAGAGAAGSPNGRIRRVGLAGAGLALVVAVLAAAIVISRPSPSGEPITNTIGMKLVPIPAGSFRMGWEDGGDDEKPVHTVQITKPFYLGVTEVTQRDYQKVMDSNPSYFSSGGGGKDKVAGQDTRRLPVEGVLWLNAVAFCNKLSMREGLTPYYRIDGQTVTIAGGNGYRLPTEAEWEYACRAGTATKYTFGDEASRLGEFAWFSGNSGGHTHPVGEKWENAFGLCDMYGNVCEWCWDSFSSGYYSKSPLTDPTGPDGTSSRVTRGGCFYGDSGNARSAYRDGYSPGDHDDYVGFRVARSSPLSPVR